MCCDGSTCAREPGGATDFEAVVRRIGQGIDGLLAQLPNHQPSLAGSPRKARPLRTGALRRRCAPACGGDQPGAGAGGDRLWIEKLRLDTRPPEGAGKARAEAIDDLARVLAEAPHDAALLASLGEQLRAFADKVPAELLEAVPELAAVREGRFDALLEEVSAGLLARLQDDGDAQ